jgi:EAL domain-containing protein (putative c-di-GMP-specific phosphodiesterase class I)
VKGFRLSIDDFGVGYSSLVALARLPFSELKVDRSFVMAAPQSAEARDIIRAVIGLARSLGLGTVAEGVEDAETLVFLRDHGCDHAQGFHISRPLAPAAASDWLQAGAGR